MTSAFSDILLHLGEFFELCQDLSLYAEAETGRFGVYRSRIGQLNGEIDRLRAGESERLVYRKLAEDLRRYLVALAESQEVGGLLPFLRVCSPQELMPKIRALLAGPELPSDEDQTSNQARNIQFELWLAATLWRVGIPVELAEPDIRCKIGDTTVLFACKRLLSVKKLTRRINEATEQLQRNLEASPERTAWGFIAISLSRVLGKTDQSEAIANRTDGLDRLASRIEVLVTRRARWQQTREAQGVLFHLGSMFTNNETNRIESGHYVTLYGSGPVCEALAGKLHSGAAQ